MHCLADGRCSLLTGCNMSRRLFLALVILSLLLIGCQTSRQIAQIDDERIASPRAQKALSKNSRAEDKKGVQPAGAHASEATLVELEPADAEQPRTGWSRFLPGSSTTHRIRLPRTDLSGGAEATPAQQFGLSESDVTAF